MRGGIIIRILAVVAALICVLFCCGFGYNKNDGCSRGVSRYEAENSVQSYGEKAKNTEEELLGSFKESLPDGMEGLSEPNGITDAVNSLSLREIIGKAIEDRGFLRSFLFTLMAVALVLVLAEHNSGEYSGALRASVAWVGSVVIFSLIGGVIADVAGAITELSSFMKGLTPVMTAALIAGGGASSAGVMSSGINLTLYFISSLGEPVLLLLAASGFALGAAGAVGGGHAALCRGMRSAFFRVLGVVSAAFSGVIALQSYVAGISDSAAIRAAKHAAQSMIPIVGQGVSGAISAVMGGVGYSAGIIGSGSVAAILLLVLSPLVALLLVRLSVSLCLILLEFCHAPSAIGLFSSFVGAIDSVTAVYAMTIIVCIMHIVLFAKGGSRIYG